MKKDICTLLLIHLLALCMQAQTKISGSYNKDSNTFETSDTGYWIDFFHNGVARISRDGYVGLIDSNGTILCTPRYDKIYDFENNVARVGLNGKYGLLNKQGAQLLPPDLYMLSPFTDGMASFKKTSSGLEGLLNESGITVTESKYNSISDFKNGRARYQKEGIYGILDSDGKEYPLLTSNDFPEEILKRHYPAPDISSMDKDNMHLLIYNNGLAPFMRKVNGKQQYGYINPNGKITVAPQFDEVTDFRGDYALIKKDDKWGVIKTDGSMLISPRYHTLESTDVDLFIVSDGNKWGVVNKENKPIMPVKYAAVRYLFKSLFGIYDSHAAPGSRSYKNTSGPVKQGAWGVLDQTGKTILPFSFDGVNRFTCSTGTAVVVTQKNSLPVSQIKFTNTGFYRFFNETGFISNEETEFLTNGADPSSSTIESAFPFPPADDRYKNNPFISTSNRYIDKNGKILINRVFDLALPFVQHFAVVGMSKTAVQKQLLLPGSIPLSGNYIFGLIKMSGEIVVPIMYDAVNFYEGVAAKDFLPVMLNGKWGVVDYRNNTIVPFIYDHITAMNTGAVVKISNKFGCIDFKGKELLPAEYDEIREMESGVLQVKKDYKTYLVDKRGSTISL